MEALAGSGRFGARSLEAKPLQHERESDESLGKHSPMGAPRVKVKAKADGQQLQNVGTAGTMSKTPRIIAAAQLPHHARHNAHEPFAAQLREDQATGLGPLLGDSHQEDQYGW